MTKPRGPMPESLKRAPVWLLAHGIDPEDPEQDPPEDGYSTDAAGTFTDE